MVIALASPPRLVEILMLARFNKNSIACVLAFLLLLCSGRLVADELKQASTMSATRCAGNAASSDMIWKGFSGGFCVEWTTKDVAAAESSTAGASAFSLAHELRQSFERENTPHEAKNATAPNPCLQENRVAVLSVAGSIISLRETSMLSCKLQAHPGGETRLYSIDLAKSAAPKTSTAKAEALKLTDYFSAATVFRSLRQDALVQKALETTGASPKTLDDLIAALSSSPAVLDDKHCYIFPEDLLSRFAFHHLQKDKVGVRLGLPGAGPCRDNLTSIGILLPAPRSLQKALSAASSRSQGFLMKDTDAVAQGRQTTISFHSGP